MTVFVDTTSTVNHRRWAAIMDRNEDADPYIVDRRPDGAIHQWWSVRGGDGEWDEESETWPEVGSFCWVASFASTVALLWVQEGVTLDMIREFCTQFQMKLMQPETAPIIGDGTILATLRWDNDAGSGNRNIIGWGTTRYFTFW